MIDLNYAAHVLPLVLRASVFTIEAWLGAIALAGSLGLGVAIARLSGIRPLTWSASTFTEVIRSTPLLVQVYYVFFVLPYFGVVLDGLTAAIVAIGVHNSTYAAEIYRSALQGVPRGQWEAAKALNLPAWIVWRRVILPQALPLAVPMMGGQLIYMIKDTPYLATVGVRDLLGEALNLGTNSLRYLEPLLIVAGCYLVWSLFTSGLFRWLEVRVATQ